VRFDAALPWYERAVKEAEAMGSLVNLQQGDVHGRSTTTAWC
jgi:hypothetical protein